MHSYVAVWQQPVEAGENSGTDGQRQFYFLGALGRRRCRKRTPGVVVDELDAGSFQSAAKSQVIGYASFF